jgi:uncharacterized protein (DUF952 family)
MILHITTRESWATAVSTPRYSADSLHTEGFIHCSTPEQVLKPANEMFRDQTNLILLCIDPALVEADIVYEDCYESGMAFPHIYGRLNTNAVIKTVDFPPNEDGSFSLPTEL